MQVIGLEANMGWGTNSPTKLVDRLGVADGRGSRRLQLGKYDGSGKRVKWETERLGVCKGHAQRTMRKGHARQGRATMETEGGGFQAG
jgi:hypothetical protein